MAWRSESRAPRAIAVLVAVLVAIVVVVGHGAANAGPRCDQDLTLSVLTARYGLAPPRADRLGVDLLVRTVEVGWGGGCEARQHQLDVGELEAPTFGVGASTLRLGAYRRAWSGPGWAWHVGLRAFARRGDDWRLATPLVGGRGRIGAALGVRGEVALAGLAYRSGEAPPASRSEVDLDLAATWPDQAATRGELRLRVRELVLAEGRHVPDVTVTAGVGLALRSRDGLRALPGFLGLAARIGHASQAMVVVEWTLGVGPS